MNTHFRPPVFGTTLRFLKTIEVTHPTGSCRQRATNSLPAGSDPRASLLLISSLIIRFSSPIAFLAAG
jgi:hypothetical protein